MTGHSRVTVEFKSARHKLLSVVVSAYGDGHEATTLNISGEDTNEIYLNTALVNEQLGLFYPVRATKEAIRAAHILKGSNCFSQIYNHHKSEVVLGALLKGGVIALEDYKTARRQIRLWRNPANAPAVSG